MVMSEENNELLKEKYSSTIKEYKKVKKIKTIYKITVSFLLLIYIIFLITYFSLPQFKLTGISYTGLVNLTKEDVITLLDESPNKSLLFFNSSGKDKVLINNSNEIILDNNIIVTTDSFSGYVHITEDYPVAFISTDNLSKLYFSSGKSFNEYETSLNSTNLSDSSKERILNEFKKYDETNSNYHLPTIHYSSSISSFDDLNIKKSLYYLQGVDVSSLSRISDINYPENKGDSTSFSNGVIELYIDASLNNGKSLYLANIRSNKLYALLKEDTFIHAIKNMNEFVEKNEDKILKSDITFSDSTIKNEVYNFRFRFNDKYDTFTIEAIKNEVNL